MRERSSLEQSGNAKTSRGDVELSFCALRCDRKDCNDA